MGAFEQVVEELDRGLLVTPRKARSTRILVQSSMAVNW